MKRAGQTRREFLAGGGLFAGSLLLNGCLGSAKRQAAVTDRPNVLWITCEDIGPCLGCYGDALADTPNLDRLAAGGVRYTNAYVTAPVCAPVRSCIITGVYATSLGTQHLRSDVVLPREIRCFSEYLREAGYYCTNNSKKDYNFTDVNAWDESSAQAHWRKRREGQPFFSVFNIMNTHQSQINGSDEEWHEKYGRLLADAERHDPAQMTVPPYYPDSPMVRKILARYYDLITLMDRRVGEILAELEADGLADDTIVFFYSDHGFGMPRYKRVLYDTGLRVPFIVHIPEKYAHLARGRAGASTDRLISTVDLAPTMLGLLGLTAPDYMQGTAFLGPGAGQPREYVFGASSRVDEAYEMARCVRGRRYKYIRNYLPHLPLIQTSAYCDKAEIMQELRRLAEGDLTEAQAALWRARPAEELYDTQADPLELNNLADSSKHAKIKARLKAELRAWMIEIRDAGLLSEAAMHVRSAGSTPYEMARRPEVYPIQRILAAADCVGVTCDEDQLLTLLQDADSGVRFWGVIAATCCGQTDRLTAAVQRLLADKDANVRFAAAGLLARWAGSAEAIAVLTKGLDEPDGPTALFAARELELAGAKASMAVEKIEAARAANFESQRHKDYKMFIDWALTGAIRACGVQTDYLITF
ncbi:MAG: sulfatase-like hydrolase/transferase [Phycisphaerae bacterium]|nr:sulfatase-like hydrolase/transferase [Phycisphaerae bacterium]